VNQSAEYNESRIGTTIVDKSTPNLVAVSWFFCTLENASRDKSFAFVPHGIVAVGAVTV
jgi:hypothetical protein